MEFLALEWIGKPIWMWAGFLSLVVALLAFDLGVLNKADREMGIGESLKLSAFYFAVSIAYGSGIWWAYEAGHIGTEDGTHAGITYFTGFFIFTSTIASGPPGIQKEQVVGFAESTK